MTTTETSYRPGEYGYQQRRQQGRGGQSWNPTGRPSDRSFRYLRFTWSEDRKTVVYFCNTTILHVDTGFYTAPYRGDPLDYSYNQFTGTVQVMKAVKDHLVLYFCERLPDSRQFTIVLSRQLRQLDSQEIHGIHSLLRRRGFPWPMSRKSATQSADYRRASSPPPLRYC
ncbi:uncharacterized protein LOC113370250 [Ctenocephalides felis]|uniref:uncharacterized protein LOC113370250 n=1 Tax=Ctenocephalides felis TaxID=7515 RepID=UPI000E6E233F|nr:uncharacterized protein LOC113370250 [Ctenocephalides felis]